MASRRFASSITFSEGTKMNSASLSTNFLMSHGQATRSTFTCSRVIHFMGRLLWDRKVVDVARVSRRVGKYCGTMGLRQEGVNFASLAIQRQRVGAGFRRHHLSPAHRANVYDIDDPWIADCHIQVSGSRIEKNHVRGAAERHVTEDAA